MHRCHGYRRFFAWEEFFNFKGQCEHTHDKNERWECQRSVRARRARAMIELWTVFIQVPSLITGSKMKPHPEMNVPGDLEPPTASHLNLCLLAVAPKPVQRCTTSRWHAGAPTPQTAAVDYRGGGGGVVFREDERERGGRWTSGVWILNV